VLLGLPIKELDSWLRETIQVTLQTLKNESATKQDVADEVALGIQFLESIRNHAIRWLRDENAGKQSVDMGTDTGDNKVLQNEMVKRVTIIAHHIAQLQEYEFTFGIDSSGTIALSNDTLSDVESIVSAANQQVVTSDSSRSSHGKLNEAKQEDIGVSSATSVESTSGKAIPSKDIGEIQNQLVQTDKWALRNMEKSVDVDSGGSDSDEDVVTQSAFDNSDGGSNSNMSMPSEKARLLKREFEEVTRRGNDEESVQTRNNKQQTTTWCSSSSSSVVVVAVTMLVVILVSVVVDGLDKVESLDKCFASPSFLGGVLSGSKNRHDRNEERENVSEFEADHGGAPSSVPFCKFRKFPGRLDKLNSDDIVCAVGSAVAVVASSAIGLFLYQSPYTIDWGEWMLRATNEVVEYTVGSSDHVLPVSYVGGVFWSNFGFRLCGSHAKRDGPGICDYNDGSQYDGDWKNDVREGTGRYIWTTDDPLNEGECKSRDFRGSWVNDQINGWGKLVISHRTLDARWGHALQALEGIWEKNILTKGVVVDEREGTTLIGMLQLRQYSSSPVFQKKGDIFDNPVVLHGRGEYRKYWNSKRYMLESHGKKGIFDPGPWLEWRPNLIHCEWESARAVGVFGDFGMDLGHERLYAPALFYEQEWEACKQKYTERELENLKIKAQEWWDCDIPATHAEQEAWGLRTRGTSNRIRLVEKRLRQCRAMDWGKMASYGREKDGPVCDFLQLVTGVRATTYLSSWFQQVQKLTKSPSETEMVLNHFDLQVSKEDGRIPDCVENDNWLQNPICNQIRKCADALFISKDHERLVAQVDLKQIGLADWIYEEGSKELKRLYRSWKELDDGGIADEKQLGSSGYDSKASLQQKIVSEFIHLGLSGLRGIMEYVPGVSEDVSVWRAHVDSVLARVDAADATVWNNSNGVYWLKVLGLSVEHIEKSDVLSALKGTTRADRRREETRLILGD